MKNSNFLFQTVKVSAVADAYLMSEALINGYQKT